jgi:hypothetical protein
MKEDEWREQFSIWLEGFTWEWFCSMTFRPGLSQAQARWRMRKWVGALRDALGTADFGFVSVPETGSTRLNFHFHILVTGLRECDASARLDWMRRWHKLAGDAHITKFNPGHGGIRYALKTIGPDSMDSIEFELNSSTRMKPNLGDQ